MPFTVQSRQELRQQSRADLAARLATQGPALRRRVSDVVGDVIGEAAYLQYRFLVWQSLQFLPDTQEGAFLARSGDIYSVPRKLATAATGTATFSGVAGVDIPAGTGLLAADGVTQFATTADVVITGGGTVDAPIAAVTAGAVTNLATSAILTLSSAISGVVATAVVAGLGTTGGADDETDLLYRPRVLDRIRTPPQGGAATDYATWAEACEGVTRAWSVPLNRGPGTVDVMFVMDGRSDIIPLSADIAVVQAAIDLARPVTADVLVFAPVADPLAVTFSAFSPNTAAAHAAAQGAISGFIANESSPGGTLRFSRLVRAIEDASGVTYFTLSAPTADVTAATSHIATLGTVTFP